MNFDNIKMIILIWLLILAPLSFANLRPIKSDKSLYEFGLIAGAGFVPDYPASDQGRIRYVGAPIVRYRGLRLRSDEEDSMKARIFSDPMYGFDLSAGGSFPANSDKNEARKGMPDLDWMAELGPRYYMYLVKNERVWLRFFLPLRAAFSTDLTSATYQGLVFAPSLNLRYFFDDTKFNSLILGVTRNYTTRQLQEYYFGVKEKFATHDRSRYSATDGYLSTSIGMAYIYEKNNRGFYTGFGINSYKGAANAGSPLHKADYNFGAFIGLSFTFYHSEERGYQ